MEPVGVIPMNKPPFSLGLAFLFTAAFLSAGCKETSLPPAPAVPVVTVAVPAEQMVTEHLDFSGKTAAAESVELRARVGGYLESLCYKEGDEVKKGQVLFKIDPRQYQADLDEAQARVEGAKAQVTESENAYQRALRLFPTGAMSAEEAEKVSRTRDVSAAALVASRANLAEKQLNRDFASVTAPIDGRADKADVTVGNLVSANLGDATVLTNIVRMEPMYVYFDVDELTVLRILGLRRDGKLAPRDKKPLEVLLGLGEGSDYPIHGTIDFVSNQLDPEKGTVTVRGVFSNKDRGLAPGLFARIRVPLGEPHKALLVNDRALGTNQGQKFLYIVNAKNQVEYRPVTIGALHHGLREVVDGLKAGERIVVKGLLRARPGVTVEPKSGEVPPESTKKG
jgi:RND family efflux transporter MFP subunit